MWAALAGVAADGLREADSMLALNANALEDWAGRVHKELHSAGDYAGTNHYAAPPLCAGAGPSSVHAAAQAAAAAAAELSRLCGRGPGPFGSAPLEDQGINSIASPTPGALQLLAELLSRPQLREQDHRRLLDLVMKLEVPSLQWAAPGTPAPAPELVVQPQPAGQTQQTPALHARVGTAGGAAAQQAPAPELDGFGPPGRDRDSLLQRACSTLQSWAAEHLRRAQPDTGGPPAELAEQLVRAAAGAGAGAGARPPATWYTLPATDMKSGPAAATRTALRALYHTAASPEEAWARIAGALTHGLAAPDGTAERVLGRVRGEGRPEPQRWTHAVCAARLAELRVAAERSLQELLAQRQEASATLGITGREDQPVAGTVAPQPPGPAPPPLAPAAHSPSPPRSAAADVRARADALLPATPLQLTGQALLRHAAAALPPLAQLPGRVPGRVLRCLYGRPFARAVGQAVEEGLTMPTAAAPGRHSPDPRVAPQQHPPRAAPPAGRAGGARPPRAPLPGRQEPREHEAAGPSGGAAAGVEEGAAGAATGAGLAAGAALQPAHDVLNRLVEIFRDVDGFQRGFADIVYHATAAVHTAGGGAPADGADGAAHGAAAAMAGVYVAEVRAEVTAALLDTQTELKNRISSVFTCAVEACLACEDPQQPPTPVALPPAAWPSAACLGPAHGSGGHPTGSPDGGRRAEVGTMTDAAQRAAPAEADAGERPPAVAAAAGCVLALVSKLREAVGPAPEPLRAPLAGAALDCLALLLDHLHVAACAQPAPEPAHAALGAQPSAAAPLRRALLAHSAAACCGRQLRALGAALGAAVAMDADGAGDGERLELERRLGECVTQADHLLGATQFHALAAHAAATQACVAAALDATSWLAFRPPPRRGRGPGPGVRLWCGMIGRLAREAAGCVAPAAAAALLGQALAGGLALMAHRGLAVAPSWQMAPEAVSDAAAAAAAAWALTQPLPLYSPPAGEEPEQGQEARAVAVRAACSPADSQEPCGRLAGAGALRVPPGVCAAVAGVAREWLTRAALLFVDGSLLAELAGGSRGEGGGDAMATGQPTDSASPRGAAGQPGLGAADRAGHLSGPLPDIRAHQRAAGTTARAASPSTMPDMHPQAPQPVAEGGPRPAPDPAAAATPPPRPPPPPPPSAPAASAHFPYGTGAAADGAATDPWAWLGPEVLRELRSPHRALHLGHPPAGLLQQQAGDDMGMGALAEERALRPQDPPRPGQAGPSPWCRCLWALAAAAPPAQLRDALRRRPELRAAIPGLPLFGDTEAGKLARRRYGEGRAAVRGLAGRLGMALERDD